MYRNSSAPRRCWATLLAALPTIFLGFGSRQSVFAAEPPAANPPAASSERDPSRQPNIVLFISDGHGYRDTPVYDPSSPIATPSLSRIAAAGTTYTHAFTASPACAPSQHNLHTGSFVHYDRPGPERLGSQRSPAEEPDGAPDGAPEEEALSQPKSVSVYLKAMGYRLVLVGPAPDIEARRFPFEIIAGQIQVPGQLPADGQIDLAAWLRRESTRDHRPLFLVINDLPHPDAPQPDGAQPDAARNDSGSDLAAAWRSGYAGRVTAMDRRLGVAFDAVQESLDPAETLFMYTSEHGPRLPFAKWNLYDLGIRVPLVTVWRDHIPPGSRTDAMVSSVDILPTLVEIAGGTPPSEIDGRSFAGVLRGEGHEHRDVIFASVGGDGATGVYPSCAVRDRRFKYIRNLSPESDFTTPDRHFKKFFRANSRYHQRPPEELYDLLSDPSEQRNLADDPAYVGNLMELRGQVSIWLSGR